METKKNPERKISNAPCQGTGKDKQSKKMKDETKSLVDIKKKMPSEEELIDTAEFFKVFGDSTRIRILCVLFEGELCVNDIVELLEVSQSAVSHQLRLLKQARVVKFRKKSNQVIYSLDDEHIKGIFDLGLSHIRERY